MIKRLRRGLLRALTPVQKWMQKIHRPEYKTTDRFYFEVLRKIRDGDVLLSREDWHLTNPFIPGRWKHAAIYIGGFVVEAVGDGVQKVSLANWIFRKDHVMILRPKFLSEMQSVMSGLRAMDQVGKPYDFEFGGGTKSFYCSELVYWSYKQVNVKNPFTLRESLGISTVIPSDFENAREKFEIVVSS